MTIWAPEPAKPPPAGMIWPKGLLVQLTALMLPMVRVRRKKLPAQAEMVRTGLREQATAAETGQEIREDARPVTAAETGLEIRADAHPVTEMPDAHLILTPGRLKKCWQIRQQLPEQKILCEIVPEILTICLRPGSRN